MPEIHPTAVIAPGARIGEHCVIGPGCVIGAEVILGEGVVLGAHVVVEGRTAIGPNTRVSAFASIGAPPQDLKYRGEDTSCEVGANCQIREGVSIHRGSVGSSGRTVVGDGCMLMVNSHVAHDCILGNGVILANNVMLAGHVQIGDGAFFGGGSAVHQTVRIGRLAMISGMAGVTNDVPPFGYVFGQPARLVGFNRIGLLRRRVGRDQLRLIRQANSLLFKEPGEFAGRLALAAERYAEEPLVMEIISFIQDPSRRRELVRPGRMSLPEFGAIDEENGEEA